MVRLSRLELTCIGLYLLAIVTANWAVSVYGQTALPVTAVLLIPFDLVTRDVLHEHWHGRHLWPKMATLIFTGSALSAALSLPVAVASFAAFAAAGFSNAVVYRVLWSRSRMVRMNGSNAVAAIVDSLTFPSIAFSVVDYGLCAAQATSKFAGGLVLTYLYVVLRENLHTQVRN